MASPNTARHVQIGLWGNLFGIGDCDNMMLKVDGPSGAGNGPVASILIELLGSAESALARDSAKARQLISKATAILIAELDGRREAAATSPPPPRQSALSPWQKRRVLEHIDRSLDGPIKIDDLASIARLSASYFARAFRADFGRSPHAYIVDQRLKRAKELMLTTDKSLAAIAVACGLADHAHLTRLFRRAVGETPARWRRRTSRLAAMREPHSWSETEAEVSLVSAPVVPGRLGSASGARRLDTR
jgi:AraC-like DNA-binding protein